jgi:hypothetical protein
MRRFGDILRLLSSLVLGLMVRDVDNIVDGFNAFYSTHPKQGDFLAGSTAVLLIGVFFRNIHGSSVYDEWYTRRKMRPLPSFERYRLGKFLTLLLLLGTLFVAPALTAHYFVHHLRDLTTLGVFVLLFMSFALYLAWNLLLWLPEDKYSDVGHVPEIADIALNWLRIDMGSAILVAFLGLYWVYNHDRQLPMPKTLVGCCFCCVAAWTIVADYWVNRSFYFPVHHEAGEDA